MVLSRSSGGYWFLAFVILAITAACSPVPDLTPVASPQVVEVAYPPSLRLVEEALNSCALTNDGIALKVSEIPGEELEGSSADLILWSGEPPESAGFSAPLAVEEIVLIVHPENPARVLTLGEISALYQGEIENWQELVEIDEPVTVWAYTSGNEVQTGVMDELLPIDAMTPSRFLAPDPLAMLQAVASQAGAIGFLPEAWITDGVVTIEIEGVEEAKFRRPVLAFSKSAPSGAVRRLLACLQGPTGQNILDRRYEPWSE